MRLKIHLRLEDNELFFQTLLVRTKEVVFTEMDLQLIVVAIVDRFASLTPAVANMTPFMLFPAVSVQLILAVESLPTEAAFRVAFEAALVNCAGVVVAKLLVLSKFWIREELMFVSEDLLVSCAELAHDFLMRAPYVSMEVAPA